MDEVEVGAGFSRFVRLKVADKMPPDLKVGRLGDFL